LLGSLVLIALGIGATAAAFAAPSDRAENLLRGKHLSRSEGVTQPWVITDGRAVHDGAEWRSDRTAAFASTAAFVQYDLGSSQALAAVWLHADNNDEYELLVSEDGQRFARVWLAEPHPDAGMQPRFTNQLGARARYVRIRPTRGDAAMSISELQLFASVPEPFPPWIARKRALSFELSLRSDTLLFGFALVLALWIARRDSPRWQLGLALVIAAAGAVSWGLALARAWPAGSREVALVRAVVAAVAACAVLREACAPARRPAHRGVTVGVLGVCAALGLASFYNLGHPQFYNVQERTWTLAHQLDLRQYYVTAKYFDEVGYRGIYEADVLAEAEERGVTVEALASIRMRDLYSLADSDVAQQRERILKRRNEFTEERWRAYRRDTGYFRDAMGEREYLETLLDYGGNATPVWMSIAHVLFSAMPPSNGGFVLTGLIDALLIGITLLAIARVYGLRSALVCAVIFGANDFIMYGTNWAGSTLRHDWLAYLGLGVCALRRERWLLGGALFGLATMIRAFPVLALSGLALQAGWSVVAHYQTARRLPAWRVVIQQNRNVLRVFGGALACMVAAFVLSILVLPPEAWPDWYAKVSKMHASPHYACVSLRSLIGGADSNQYEVLRSRAPLYATLLAVYTAGVALACRARRPEQAAVLGLTLLPVLMSPSNYYLHVVYLFPLLVIEHRPSEASSTRALEAGVWVTLLGLCALQYFTVLVPDLALHFYLSSALLIGALSLIWALLIAPDLRRWLGGAAGSPVASGTKPPL
jgi:hypothetical protein